MDADMSVSEARSDLSAVTARAEFRGETTFLTKHGRRIAAVVPSDSAELLEQLEDLLDKHAVRSALERLRNGEEAALPFVRRTGRQSA